MNPMTKLGLMTLGVIAASATLGSDGIHVASAAGDEKVVVENKAEHPVPVTVGDPIALDPTQTVALPVVPRSLTSGKNALVVLDANASQQPFADGWQMPMGDGTGFVVMPDPIVTPAGKRAVVEQVSVHGTVPAGQQVSAIYVYTYENAQDGSAFGCNVNVVPVKVASINGYDYYIGTQTMHVYNEGTHALGMGIYRDSGAGTSNWNVFVSGVLVDTP